MEGEAGTVIGRQIDMGIVMFAITKTPASYGNTPIRDASV